MAFLLSTFKGYSSLEEDEKKFVSRDANDVWNLSQIMGIRFCPDCMMMLTDVQLKKLLEDFSHFYRYGQAILISKTHDWIKTWCIVSNSFRNRKRIRSDEKKSTIIQNKIEKKFNAYDLLFMIVNYTNSAENRHQLTLSYMIYFFVK